MRLRPYFVRVFVMKNLTQSLAQNLPPSLLSSALALMQTGVAIVEIAFDREAELPKVRYPIIFANHSFAQMVGATTPDAVCNADIRSFTFGENTEALSDALQLGIPQTLDLRHQSKDGTLFYAQVQIAPVGDKSDRPTHFVCTYTDLTDLWETNDTLMREKEQLEQNISKRTKELQEFIDEMRTELQERRVLEAELRLAEQRYRSLAKNFPNGVVVLFAENLDCILCEGELSERLRLHRTDSGALHLEPEIMNILKPSIYEAFEGKNDAFEVEIAEQPFLVHIVPMVSSTDAEKSRTGAVGIDAVMLVLQDISDFKARQELEQEREMTALKYRFVTIASHELRTPLAGMMLSSGILRRYWNTTSEEEKRESIQDIITGLDRMSKLVDDILFVGKSEAGKLPFAPQMLDLSALCAEYVNECVKGIGLKHTTLSDFPPTPLHIYADKKLTQLIVNNLLTNAYKYSPSGSEVHISLHSQMFGDVECAVLTVRDAGIGIPADDIPNLFKSFHRGRNVGEIQGTGLGLAMVERAVEQHGGTIQVQSVEKEGTTFIVKLPMTKEAHSLTHEA